MADKEIKLEYSKTEDGKILLVLSSVYQHNCSARKTVIVDDDVLEVFRQSNRERERERSRRRRHGSNIYLGESESFDAALGLVTNAPDEAVEDKLYLEYIKRFFDDKVYNRGIMYYLNGITQCEIADIEGVSATAVHKSIVKFKRVMTELYKNEF
ncbi:MAG: hypothetical protein HDT42_06425 [Ruminococcaceae bacterium]|nr:hypothetical protein [Oscillospiraceae bacterium]